MSSSTKRQANKATLDEDNLFQPKRAKKGTKGITFTCLTKQTTLRLVTPSKAHTNPPTSIAKSTQTQRTEVRQTLVIDLVMVKKEFPAWSIVSING